MGASTVIGAWYGLPRRRASPPTPATTPSWCRHVAPVPWSHGPAAPVIVPRSPRPAPRRAHWRPTGVNSDDTMRRPRGRGPRRCRRRRSRAGATGPSRTRRRRPPVVAADFRRRHGPTARRGGRRGPRIARTVLLVAGAAVVIALVAPGITAMSSSTAPRPGRRPPPLRRHHGHGRVPGLRSHPRGQPPDGLPRCRARGHRPRGRRHHRSPARPCTSRTSTWPSSSTPWPSSGRRAIVSSSRGPSDTTVVRLTPADMSLRGCCRCSGSHDDVVARDVCADLANADALVGIYMDAGGLDPERRHRDPLRHRPALRRGQPQAGLAAAGRRRVGDERPGVADPRRRRAARRRLRLVGRRSVRRWPGRPGRRLRPPAAHRSPAAPATWPRRA